MLVKINNNKKNPGCILVICTKKKKKWGQKILSPGFNKPELLVNPLAFGLLCTWALYLYLWMICLNEFLPPNPGDQGSCMSWLHCYKPYLQRILSLKVAPYELVSLSLILWRFLSLSLLFHFLSLSSLSLPLSVCLSLVLQFSRHIINPHKYIILSYMPSQFLGD